MNNNIEILNKLKESLKANLKSFMSFADNSTANYTEVTTTDGKKLQVVGDVIVGSEIYVLDEQGVQTPLEDGEYVLDNGLTINVMNNKIEEVSSTTEEKTDTEDMGSATENMADTTTPTSPEDSTATEADTTGTDKMAALEEKVAMLEEAIKSIMDFINTQGQANEQMMSKIEEMASAPAAEPVKQAKKVYTLSTNTIAKGDMDEIRKMKELFSDKGVKFPG